MKIRVKWQVVETYSAVVEVSKEDLIEYEPYVEGDVLDEYLLDYVLPDLESGETSYSVDEREILSFRAVT